LPICQHPIVFLSAVGNFLSNEGWGFSSSG